MSNGITLHEAVTQLVDAEVALARHLDELGVVGITDNPGARTSYGTDLFNAMCMVVCIDAESSGHNDLLAALGCDQVCGEGWSWDNPPIHGDGSLPYCECGVCMRYRAEQNEAEEEDDDPRCVCGVYRSEHSMMGCPEGFQTPASWEVERAAIREEAYRDAYGFDRHDDETDDQYYQSRGEYYCKHGVYVGSPGGADHMCGRCEME
jgi:hypothetical protein